ncbi:hypothetical protein [Natroniella sp. ANB-PHB2]|uniref:hypothetical protein n=1 Tax=Natroniella sp. ANB-PHB2 TaxID=3384444 RepID=UPI0038D43D07
MNKRKLKFLSWIDKQLSENLWLVLLVGFILFVGIIKTRYFWEKILPEQFQLLMLTINFVLFMLILISIFKIDDEGFLISEIAENIFSKFILLVLYHLTYFMSIAGILLEEKVSFLALLIALLIPTVSTITFVISLTKNEKIKLENQYNIKKLRIISMIYINLRKFIVIAILIFSVFILNIQILLSFGYYNLYSMEKEEIIQNENLYNLHQTYISQENSNEENNKYELTFVDSLSVIISAGEISSDFTGNYILGIQHYFIKFFDILALGFIVSGVYSIIISDYKNIIKTENKTIN